MRIGIWRLTLSLSVMVLQPPPAVPWVYPEHRDITRLAIEQLDPRQRALLQKLWSESRAGHEARLCASLSGPQEDPTVTCIDYAALAAIAGDHSCSAREMLKNVVETRWILVVARVGARLEIKLSDATRRDQRVNAVRSSDNALQRADPDYIARASSNNAHFVLARPDTGIDSHDYAKVAIGPNAEINSVATYMWYHLRALSKARRISRNNDSSPTRAQIALAALADEAFALHFLEDSFAAGHVVGNWGNSAVRKGTHDYYGDHGLEVVTWDHHRYVALGDANIRPQDAQRAAAAVRDSLAQLTDALEGKVDVGVIDDSTGPEPDGFDVCHESHPPASIGEEADIRLSAPIITQTPVPALGRGIGELPRFRSELGAFVGLSTGVRAGALTRGFGSTQTGASGVGGLDAAVRLGLGVEGVLNESSDGLAFAEIGLRQDTPTQGSVRLPGRGAIATRFRAPFWLIPGDLVLTAPFLAFTSPRTLKRMAAQAANGGLIPWQSGIATRIGRFQFVLGREVGLSFYSHGRNHPILLSTPGVTPVNFTLVAINSIQVEIPILEYRVFRSFSLNQSSALAFQPYIGFDRPSDLTVVSPPGSPTPHAHTIVTAGIRIVFDWRYYVSGF